MAVSAVYVGSSERFSFTLFLAAAVHMLVVLGVSFSAEDLRQASSTIEVTLSQFDDAEAPEEADYLAATNQQGSGELAQKSEVTTTETPTLQDDQVKPVRPVNVDATRAKPQTSQEKKVITTLQQSPDRRAPSEFDLESPEPQPVKPLSVFERSLEIASLEARVDTLQRNYAKRPRVTRVTAASSRKDDSAYYMVSWIEKVTRIGNLNYPDEARRKGLYGNLKLLVALYPDGSLKEIRVLETSGHRVLDDAAIRTVRLGAPYAPFSDAMRLKTDVLEIIRTWSFERGGLSSF